jgi:integrase
MLGTPESPPLEHPTMPRRPDLSWDKANRRWLKEYRGKKYSISCRQLRELGHEVLSDTKEGSYIAANAWWHRKQSELDAADRAAPRALLPMEDVFAAYIGVPPEDMAVPEQELFEIGPGVDPKAPPLGVLRDEAGRVNKALIREFLGDMLARHLLDGEPLPEQFGRLLPPARVQQLESAVAAFRGEAEAVAADRRIAFHRDRWVESQRALVRAGGLAPARADNNKIALAHFIAFLGEEAPVEVVTAARLQDFYNFCLGRVAERHGDAAGKAGWSPDYAKKVFEAARTFSRFLAEQGLIEAPNNVDSRRFRFGATAKKVETWTAQEYQRAVTAAPGKLKLALLLMANTGMTQRDISDLRDAEVDWKAGRITRKRSKTKDRKNVPTVSYPLWPLTFKLLQQYRSGGDRVLLTESGLPFVRTDLNAEGKLVKADGFASNYAHLKRRLKLGRPLKQLRKTSASLLARYADGRFVDLFLGHAPRSVADRHYVRPSQDQFDEAVMWLGRKLGQVAE